MRLASYELKGWNATLCSLAKIPCSVIIYNNMLFSLRDILWSKDVCKDYGYTSLSSSKLTVVDGYWKPLNGVKCECQIDFISSIFT